MPKTQGEIEKAKMGEDDQCADDSCRVERAANTAMVEGAHAVKEEQARKEQEPGAREEAAAYALMQKGAEEVNTPKERAKASIRKVKEDIKTGFRLIGDDIRAGAKEKAAEFSEEYIGYSPRKDWGMPEKKSEPEGEKKEKGKKKEGEKKEKGKKKYTSYLPQSRGGFNFPQMGQPVSFSPKMQKKGKKRPFTTGIRMQTGAAMGTGMVFTPPSPPRFGSTATPKGNFSMPFPAMNIKPPRFGEAHLGKNVSKRDFASGLKLNMSTSPFGKKKTNPLKGKKKGLW